MKTLTRIGGVHADNRDLVLAVLGAFGRGLCAAATRALLTKREPRRVREARPPRPWTEDLDLLDAELVRTDCTQLLIRR